MNNFYLYLALAVLALAALSQPAASQEMSCVANNGNVQAQLVEVYNEAIIERRDVPNGRAELWANDEIGSYTILFFPADLNGQVVCIAGAGIDP